MSNHHTPPSSLISDAVASSTSEETSPELALPEMAVRILEAAMQLFARKGYSATSVREIVHAAQVTNPMLYYYFESKEGLFFKLIDVLFGTMEARVRQTLSACESCTLRTQLTEVMRAHFETARENPTALRFIFAVLFGPTESHPEFNAQQRRPLIGEINALLERAIEEERLKPHAGFDVEFLTLRFFGVINQYLMFLLKESELCAQGSAEHAAFLARHLGPEMLDHLVTFFLNGAGTVRASDA